MFRERYLFSEFVLFRRSDTDPSYESTFLVRAEDCVDCNGDSYLTVLLSWGRNRRNLESQPLRLVYLSRIFPKYPSVTSKCSLGKNVKFRSQQGSCQREGTPPEMNTSKCHIFSNCATNVPAWIFWKYSRKID